MSTSTLLPFIRKTFTLWEQHITITDMNNDSPRHPYWGRFSEFLNTDDIVGRDEDLNNVLELLKTSNGRPVAICGPGHVGKSTFTHYLGKLWDELGTEYLLAFVDEKSIDLIEHFMDKLFRVCLPKCMYQCKCHRKYNYKLLIVHNNIRDFDIIKRYTQHPNNSNISVIVTTENEELDSNFIMYHLQAITEESSIQLFKNLLLQQANEEGIDQLVRTFSGLPLGLRQAAVYIKEQRKKNPGYSIQDYLQEYYKLFHSKDLSDDLVYNCDKNLYASSTMICEYIGAISTFRPGQENFPGNTSSSLSKKFQNFTVKKKKYFQDLKSVFQTKKLQSINEKAYILLNCFAFCAPWDLNSRVFNVFTKSLQQCGYPKDRDELYKVLEVLQQNFLITLVKVFPGCTVCSHFHICLRREAQVYSLYNLPQDVKWQCNGILSILYSKRSYYLDRRMQYHYFLDYDVEDSVHVRLDDKPLSQVDTHNRRLYHFFSFPAWLCSYSDDFMIKDPCILEKFVEISLEVEAIKKPYACKTSSKWRRIKTAVMFTPRFVFNLFQILSEYLPIANCDVDAQTEDGLTPLHIAIKLGNSSKAEYLIKKCCNIFIIDKEGNTPFSLALMSQNRHDLNMVKNEKQCKEIINVGGKGFIECLNLNNRRNKICVNIVKSTTGDTLRKFLVGWSICFLRKSIMYTSMDSNFDRVFQIKFYSQYIKYLETFIQELAKLLLQGNKALRIAFAYMRTERISISDLLDLLREECVHPELEAFTRESLCPEARYVYKMICLAIDGVENHDPGSYNLLSVLAYCSPPDNNFNEHKFLQYNNITNKDIDSYNELLKSYRLHYEDWNDGDVYFAEIVYSVVRTYVWHRNETRHVLQQVLHMRNKPTVTHCNCIVIDNTVPALNKTQYTDEDIDKYLKTFVPPYILFDATM